MLSNFLPIILLIPFLNWVVPWFITRYDHWGRKAQLFSLFIITALFFLLFWLDIPITLYSDHSFTKMWAGTEILILDPAELFFFLTIGISLLIIFLSLLNAGKLRWFISFLGLILLAFSLHLITVFGYIQMSSESLKKPKISLVFTGKYLALRLVNKTSNIGFKALKENDLLLWEKYHYCEKQLYTENDLPLEYLQASKKRSADFVQVLKDVRGVDAEMIEVFNEYNARSLTEN